MEELGFGRWNRGLLRRFFICLFGEEAMAVVGECRGYIYGCVRRVNERGFWYY